ncbi:MAG: hypothetical protein ABSE82_11625 [Nitrososphaerales archaeon]
MTGDHSQVHGVISNMLNDRGMGNLGAASGQGDEAGFHHHRVVSDLERAGRS